MDILCWRDYPFLVVISALFKLAVCIGQCFILAGRTTLPSQHCKLSALLVSSPAVSAIKLCLRREHQPSSSKPTQPIPSLRLHLAELLYQTSLPPLSAWQKERGGTAGGSSAPSSTAWRVAHGNTSRRFVASCSDFHRSAVPPYSETLCLLYALLILALSKPGPLSEHYYDLWAVHG